MYSLGWERLEDDDHADNAENATVIEALPYEQAARFDWGLDFDYYSLTAPATGQLTVMTESEIDPMCRIMSDGEVVAENDDIDTQDATTTAAWTSTWSKGRIDDRRGRSTTRRAPLGTTGPYTLIVRQQ